MGVLLLLTLPPLTWLALPRPLGAAMVDEIVAKVNNRIITKSELDERTKALERQLAQQYTGDELDRQLADAKDALLANIITEALLIERAETIFDMDKIRQSLIDDFKKQQNIANDEELEKALKDQNLTRRELEEQLIRLAVPSEIINYDVKRKISVSEAEQQQYYDSHKEGWATAANVTIREIVLPYTAATRDEAQKRAQDVAAQAKGGADFIALVQQNSEAGTRETQGLLGPLTRQELNTALADAAFTVPVGQTSDPIDTGRDFHVIRVEARNDATVKTLAQVRDQIYDAIRNEKFKPRFDAYLKRLWKENHIEISPKYENLLVVSPLKTPGEMNPPGEGSSLGGLPGQSAGPRPADADAFPAVGKILQARCAMPACHAGLKAAEGLRLETAHVYRTAVNVPAHSDKTLLRVSPGDPDGSLLYLRLLEPSHGHYRGPRMPKGMAPLSDDEIAQVRKWIDSFPVSAWGQPPSAEEEEIPRDRIFQDAYLTNLPTPETLGKGNMAFRFEHRFRDAARDAGSQELWGLDSGANISLELAYGLGDPFEMGLRRTNLASDYEGYFKWIPARQTDEGTPMSFGLRGSFANARQNGLANRDRFSLQVIAGHQFWHFASLMLVPTWVTTPDGLDAKDSRATLALGAGGEFRLTSKQALTLEYVPQLRGYENAYQGFSIGYGIATARHAFQLVLTNTAGSHTDQYAPGGDLNVRDAGLRLGFNISRLYALKH